MDRQTTIFTNPRAYERVIIFTSIAILALILPTIIHSQLITGSFVNMSLILVTFLIGPLEAVFLGLMPSVIALSSGLLPLPLAPAIPFIMISNTILVGIYYYLGRKNLIASIFIASFIKFLFLYGVTGSIINTLLADKMAGIASTITGYLQFLTAVIGGILAYFVLSFMKDRKA